MIKLTENYSIDTEGAGCSLLFTETRIRTKKDVTTEEYEYTDSWHFLTTSQCLERFMELSLEECSDVKEMLQKITEVRNIIQKITC